MRSRTFSPVVLSGRTEIQDERGIPFGEVKGSDESLGKLLRAVARKAYAHGAADAYARTMRSYHLAKGTFGDDGRSWDLVSTGAAVERLAWVPRSRWGFGMPANVRAMLALAQKVYGTGRADAGGAG